MRAIKDYRIEITVRNNRILEYMRQLGYITVSSFCRAHGFHPSPIGRYINLKTAPVDKFGRWKKTAVRLSKALCCGTDELWSNAQRLAAIKNNRRSVAIAEQDIMGVLEAKSPLQIIENKETNKQINEALKGLDFRQEDILRMKFGMQPYFREFKNVEIAQKYSISRSRVAGIEATCLRKLRHPKHNIRNAQC